MILVCQEISIKISQKISNCYLFDLNDLEQFFTLFFNEKNKNLFFNGKKFSFNEDESLSHFFKKLNFSNSQKEIFNSYVEEFFFKNSENNHRDIFLKFLNHLNKIMDNQKLENILDKFNDLEIKINSLNKDDYKELANLSKEYSDLKPLVENKFIFEIKIEFRDLDDLLKSDDSELKSEAEKEKLELTNKINKLESEIKFLLIPKDESDTKMQLLK